MLFPGAIEINNECANYAMRIGTTSTPGIFPEGELARMVAMIWRAMFGNGRAHSEVDYPYPAVGTAAYAQRERQHISVCVLRGGAFNSVTILVRCAVRVDFEPDDRSHIIGFRVVLSPLR